MRAVVAALVAATAVASGLVRAYSVEPRTAAESGWTDTIPGQDFVSQYVTCCWDELDSSVGAYVELFVGSRGASPGGYELDVYEVDGGVDPVASSPERVASQDHAWLEFPVGVASGYEFTKGKRYEFRFTRSGSDSINYYTAYGGTYPYGYMKVGGQDHSGPGLDNTPTDHTMA